MMEIKTNGLTLITRNESQNALKYGEHQYYNSNSSASNAFSDFRVKVLR